MKPSGETVLLYNIDSEKGRKLRMLMLRMGMRARVVDKADYGKPVGLLAGLKDVTVEDPDGEVSDFSEEMMVMRGFTERRLDLFLQSMRREGIERIDYKAILTPVNSRWNSWQLYQELKKEHEQMNSRQTL